MRIIAETARISVEEQTEEAYTLTGNPHIFWESELSAEAMPEPGPQKNVVEGLSVRMESGKASVAISLKRYGDTPDEAVKRLFEAMGDAGITL